MIECKNLKKNYGRHEVLRGVSFSVEGGRCAAIVGGNGSGKSTLLSLLAGVVPHGNASFRLDGRELFSDRRALSAAVGYVPQSSALIPELTARDNLRLWYDKKAMEASLSGGTLAMLGIPDFLGKRVSRLSGGMQKRLAIGCAVAGAPRVLLLDEPTAALDLACKEKIAAYLRAFCSAGGTVLLTTHEEREIAAADCCFLLRDGLLTPYVYDGDLSALVGLL